MIDTEHRYDVLVIGGGNAALCAAIRGRESGASVILLEHASRSERGGNSRHTRNLRCMHTAPTEVLTEVYSEEEYWQDLLRVTDGDTNERLARITIHTSDQVTRWMYEHGVRFQPSLSGTLNLACTNAFFLGGGKALLNAYYATAERLGVVIVYDAEVQQLKLEDGCFKSAVVRYRGFPIEVRAKSLVAASGGFESNIDWLKQVWGDAAENFLIRGTRFNRGRVLRELLDQGIKQVGHPDQCHAVAIDARAPKYDGGIVSRLDCVPFSIVVNKHAQRFYDEGEEFWPKRYAIWGRLVAAQEDQIAYALIDSKSVDHFIPSVFPPVQTDSIRQMAQAFGLDPDALEETVAAYNKAIHPGDFNHEALDNCFTEGLDPPKSHWARPLNTPPYYGYPSRPGITFTYLGVAVNDKARVILDDDTATSNIFAAGEIMAGNILGKGYLAGIGMTIGTVFGRIAGEEAARHALN